jgi:hypothetical protein
MPFDIPFIPMTHSTDPRTGKVPDKPRCDLIADRWRLPGVKSFGPCQGDIAPHRPAKQSADKSERKVR